MSQSSEVRTPGGQVVEEGGTHLAGTFLLGDSDTMAHGCLANRRLPGVLLFS